MESIKLVFQFAAVAGIVLAIVAELVFKSREIRITSVALALLAAIAVWAIEKNILKFPITESGGSFTMLLKWGGAEKEWKSIGFGNESTVEIFNNDTCLLKLGSGRTSGRVLEKGLIIFNNEYSTSVSGSYVNGGYEDIKEIDSIVISDPAFPSQARLIQGSLELRLNGRDYFRIHTDSISHEGKRVIILSSILDRYRIKPTEKSDFGRFSLGKRLIAGTWIGSRIVPVRNFAVIPILTVEMNVNHTYSATSQVYIQPLELFHTTYKESGLWKADKGRIRAIPEKCQGIFDVESPHFERIPCDGKHALAFEFTGDSLNIRGFSDGEPISFPMHRL